MEIDRRSAVCRERNVRYFFSHRKETFMPTHAKMSAEKKFTANLKKVDQARTEMDLAQKKRLEQTKKLRALRLEKEVRDNENEIEGNAKKKIGKSATSRTKAALSSQIATRTGK
jgi:hypothetical protein